MRVHRKCVKFAQAMADQRGLVASIDSMSKQQYQNKLKALVAKAAKEVRRHDNEGRPLIRKAK